MEERERVNSANTRARSLGLDADLTLDQWIRILSAWQYSCVYCGLPFDEIEHVTPISQGGGTTSSNCRPVCQYHNRRKGTETWSVDDKQLRLWD